MASSSGARAQEPAAPAAGDKLDAVEARLAERYDRLEILAGRLAELSGATQPRRAELLRQLVAAGRQRNVPGQFDEIIAALGDGSYSTAVDGQTRLQADLEKLLDLLLQEDRDRQLDAERKRILRYLQDLNRLIRLERGVKARTDGGDDEAELSADQQRVSEDTQALEQKIQDDEAAAKPNEERPESKANKSPQGDKPPSPSEGEQGAESQPSPGQPSDDSKPSESKPGEQQSGEPQPSEQSGEQQSGESQPGQPQPGQPSQPGESSSEQPQSPPSATPMERTAERLRRAQERMKDAEKKLKESQRGGAAEQQGQAVEELEQAKAELEKILRQLREEELERMLVLLEARFRKMLDEQTAVYEETKHLDASKAEAHEIEISAGRLSRREALIVREADRALVLLREDGTSVAFPEAVEQARDDMQQIAERLNRVKTDLLTQGMEEDVIAALEELLATVRQQLDQLRDQKSQQQPGGGAPGEQPLVDQLAELRMIRALQTRVNRRTQQYGALIPGEQATASDLLQLLDDLSLRQAKIFEATRDLETGANQ